MPIQNCESFGDCIQCIQISTQNVLKVMIALKQREETSVFKGMFLLSKSPKIRSSHLHMAHDMVRIKQDLPYQEWSRFFKLYWQKVTEKNIYDKPENY